MSWFLNRIRSKKIFFIAVCFIIFGVILCWMTKSFWFLFLPILGVVLLTVFIFIYCNSKVINIIKCQYKDFSSTSKVRNIDCMVIGDMINPFFLVKEGVSFIQIYAPGRGFLSDYEIIRHTHSILKDGGVIYIPYKMKYTNNGLSIFDYPILHPITIEKYKIGQKNKQSKYPIIYHLISSIKILFQIQAKRGFLRENIDERIDKFCSERGYKVIYVEI